MDKKIVYMDYAATTPIDEEVLECMINCYRQYDGNPSSLHSIGQNAKTYVNAAKRIVAESINTKPSNIYFTSCGSEADNWAIKGVASKLKNKGKHIITSKIEHHAILNTCAFLEREGYEVTYLSVDSEGMISLDELESVIRDDTVLISIMMANNEIGTIEPISEIGRIAHEHGVLFHTDAVQALGHIDIDVELLNVDFLSASGHKIYGPKGTGFLYVRNKKHIEPLIHGGGQEFGVRAGTENVAGIVGLAKAVEIAIACMTQRSERTKKMRDYMIAKILDEMPEASLNGPRENRLSNNLNICFDGIDGESLLLSLNNVGICASAGSACDSGSVEPSHVLLATGLSHMKALGSLRYTIDHNTSEEDVDFVVEQTKKFVSRQLHE